MTKSKKKKKFNSDIVITIYLHVFHKLTLTAKLYNTSNFFLLLHGVVWCVQVCYLEFDRKDIPMNKMVVASLESKFSVFDLRTQHPTKGFASLTEKV